MVEIRTNTTGDGHRRGNRNRTRLRISIVVGGIVAATTATYANFNDSGTIGTAYAENLAMIHSATHRNTLHDNDPWRDVDQADLDVSNTSPMLGPRTDYLGNPNGNPEQSFPVVAGGQFRTSCEFGGFFYDDSVVFPDQPGRAHLHMYFGNTDVNAYTTAETLTDSGSSTCNGQALNRTAYWVPAMISDTHQTAQIPERIVVYYKGEGLARGASEPYDYGMIQIAPGNGTPGVAEVGINVGGAQGDVEYKCTDNFSGGVLASGVNQIPNCPGTLAQTTYGGTFPGLRTVLEMEIKLWNCFDSSLPSNDLNGWRAATTGGWFFSNCGPNFGSTTNDRTFPNVTYFVNYVIPPDDNAANWSLASDWSKTSVVSGGTPTLTGNRGHSLHADWQGAWHPDINQEWIDNCVNYANGGTASGCGFGYLSDGGPNSANPLPGRALRYRPQYDTPGDISTYRAPLATIFAELCQPLGPSHSYNPAQPATAAYCLP